jgi:hypothetical protein
LLLLSRKGEERKKERKGDIIGATYVSNPRLLSRAFPERPKERSIAQHRQLVRVSTCELLQPFHPIRWQERKVSRSAFLVFVLWKRGEGREGGRSRWEQVEKREERTQGFLTLKSAHPAESKSLYASSHRSRKRASGWERMTALQRPAGSRAVRRESGEASMPRTVWKGRSGVKGRVTEGEEEGKWQRRRRGLVSVEA